MDEISSPEKPIKFSFILWKADLYITAGMPDIRIHTVVVRGIIKLLSSAE
jgi:hypothetical protein